MKQRNLYLKNTPMEEARDKYMDALSGKLAPRTETVPVSEALGRTTSQAVYARLSSPLFNAAAMDGVAVIAGRTSQASETSPLRLKMGDDYCVINTGDPVREPYDAVIMAEDIVETCGDEIEIRASAAAWQHVRPIGEDIVAGEMILRGGHIIRPIDLGVLLSGGVTEVSVWAKPRVMVFPTGDEMIEADETPKDDSIIESNSHMLAAMVEECGGEGRRSPAIPDDYDLIKAAVARAVSDSDIVIVNAGSSAGTEDYTVHILRELGEVVIHGVATKPGKPVILAVVEGKPVIGLPGYPLAAYLGFENFVMPVLSKLTCRPIPKRDTVAASLSRRLVSSLKHREYVQMKVGRVAGKIVASPLSRGAGVSMSLVNADGYCVIDQDSEGYDAGEIVDVALYRPMSEIDNTVVAVGSHDLIMDVIADMMPMLHPGMRLSSTHVGSMGGLMALRRGEAHIAPTHLLDEETGEYNLPYIERMFAGRPMALIRGLGRIQGLIVAKGNPFNITGIEDLPRFKYVNRQRGAGTRIFFDYKIRQAGISADTIYGYEREAATHMAVAASVKSGGADAGMGVMSAARTMGLDFIEIGHEQYDFAILQESLDLPHVRAFIDVLQNAGFHEKLAELGGYSWENCGEVTLL